MSYLIYVQGVTQPFEVDDGSAKTVKEAMRNGDLVCALPGEGLISPGAVTAIVKKPVPDADIRDLVRDFEKNGGTANASPSAGYGGTPKGPRERIIGQLESVKLTTEDCVAIVGCAIGRIKP